MCRACPEQKYRFVHEYLTAVKSAFKKLEANPNAKVRTWWGCNGLNLEQFRKWFLDALERRINAKGSLWEYGKKFEPDYQVSLRRDCQRVRDIVRTRLRVYQFETEEVRRRFSHLLSHYDD